VEPPDADGDSPKRWNVPTVRALNPKARAYKKNIRPALRKIVKLGTLPRTAERVLSLLNSHETDMREVVRTLETDPAISAQLLRLVNAPFFGLRQKASTVRQAVLALGLRGVRDVVLTCVAFQMLRGARGRRMEELWLHGLYSAQWASVLGRRDPAVSEGECRVAGLLHEIGQPIVLQYFPEEWKRIEELVRDGAPRGDAEAKVLGMTHGEIGAFLFRLWNFPAGLTQAVHYHHAPQAVLRAMREHVGITKIVSASCALAEASMHWDHHSGFSVLDDEFLQYHGLERGELPSLAAMVGRGAVESGRLLN
jgi:HD-like signal output (HDOD) protein